MAANMGASMRKARTHELNMAAEHKGNEGEILNFPNFCVLSLKLRLFPALKLIKQCSNYIFIEQKMKEILF